MACFSKRLLRLKAKGTRRIQRSKASLTPYNPIPKREGSKGENPSGCIRRLALHFWTFKMPNFIILIILKKLK